MAYIDLNNVSFTYPDGTRALRELTLSIEKGEKVAFLGENGSGKSTLFLLLSGLLKADKGIYSYDGKKVQTGKVGLTFQNPEVQLFAPTVYQEISYGPVNMGLSTDEIKRRINHSMERTGISSLKDRPIQYLSYGQKKKVAIADILAMGTDVFILDEPFAWLDRKGMHEMNTILEELSKLEKTVLIATHNPDFAWFWADKVVLFKSGEILACGTPEEIFYDESLLDAASINQPEVIRIARALNIGGPLPGHIDQLLEILSQKESIIYERS
jgi:cobalt/nickel transport system ATP-binding protein